MQKLAQKVVNALRFFEDVIAVGGMVLFGLLIVVEVIIRKLGMSGFPWLQEFAQYMFIIAMFIGCTRAVETDDHLIMDMIYRLTPPVFNKALRCCVDFFMVLLSGFLCWCSYNYMLFQARMGVGTQTLPFVPMVAIWAPVVLCMATMTIRYVVVLVNNIKAYISFLHGGESVAIENNAVQ